MAVNIASSRLPFIDALKAIASQLIVLHHLAFYGPMQGAAKTLSPSLFYWLSHHARIAVQVFLVIAGFLAVRSIAPEGKLIPLSPASLIKKRYFKLIAPYLIAIILAIGCASLARNIGTHPYVPTKASLMQFIAHIFLMQGLLGFDSLSAGVWYIAIDFQLFAFLICLLWIGQKISIEHEEKIGLTLIALLALGSLFYFNRLSHWDSWALYFFGAYALGAGTYWINLHYKKPYWMVLLAGAVLIALLIDFRSRIAVALFTTLVLGICSHTGWIYQFPRFRILSFLGKISYSVFLIHFPILLVFNAFFAKFFQGHPFANLLGILLTWGCSIVAGAFFFEYVEKNTAIYKKIEILLSRFSLIKRENS